MGELVERDGAGERRAREPRRDPGDDFFCLRYAIWYPSFDCAVRTKYETSPGCRLCEQGRFNLKRHASALRHARFPRFRVD